MIAGPTRPIPDKKSQELGPSYAGVQNLVASDQLFNQLWSTKMEIEA